MTAFGTIDSAVEAMRAGAFDYVDQALRARRVIFALERALERRALEQENRNLRRAVDRTSAFGELIGESPAMREIFALIRKVAHEPQPRADHRRERHGQGGRGAHAPLHAAARDKPFVPINCAAIPEGLLESELFGHVRGAFTGAHASKRGLFESADGGTLFLDEIGDMPLALQGKLLRVLQEREIRAGRRHAGGQGRRAHHRRDQPGPRGRDRARAASARISSTA